MKFLKSAFNQPVGILSGYVVFIAVVVAGGWVAGLANIEMSQPVALSLVSIGAVCGYFSGRQVSRSSTLSWFPEDSASSIAKVAGAFAWSGFVLSCILLRNAFVHHDPSWDGNVYHIPAIGLWHQEGRLHWINGDFGSLDLMNGYPKTGELLAWMVSVAFGSGWLNALNLFFMPLGFWGLVVICQLVGASRSAALIASSLFLFVPVNICQSATTYLDSAYASSVIAVLACLAFGFRGRVFWVNDLVMGCAMGLAIGLKQPGLFVFAMAVMIGFFDKFWSKKADPSSIISSALFVVGVAALVGGFWYLRNYVNGGSPLYPAELSFFGKEIFPGQPVKEMIALDVSVPASLESWPSGVRFIYTWLFGGLLNPGSWVGFDARLAGLGFVWPLVALPSIFLCIARAKHMDAPRRTCFIILALIVALAFVVQPNNWWARYTLWLYAIGLPSFALFLSAVPRKVIGKLIFIVATVAIIDSAPSFYYALTFRGIPAGQNLDASTPSHGASLPLFPEMSSRMPDVVSVKDKIIIGQLSGDNSQLLGNLMVPLGKRVINAISSEPKDDELDDLLDAGFRDLIWDKHWGLPRNVKERFDVNTEISRFYHLVARGNR